jgi:hypothetical protein
MTRLLAHLRNNTIAWVALFVALGGTSYAAFTLPANSVGTKQVRNSAINSKKLANGSVNPMKLDSHAIGGSVRHWAVVSQDGRAVAGSHGARASGGTGGLYHVNWGDRFSSRCAVLTSSPGVAGHVPIADSIGTQVVQPGSRRGATVVWAFPYSGGNSVNAPFDIAVVC